MTTQVGGNPTPQSLSIQYWIIGLWLVSFFWCLGVPLVLHPSISDDFNRVLREVVDTFAPALAVMLSFVFGKRAPSITKTGSDRWLGLLALCLASGYAAIFSVIMGQFAFSDMDTKQLIEEYQEIRPAIGFLVTAMVAFYFGSARSTPESAE
jgi:hypothetical protein